MKKEIKKKWLRALRSGKYRQATNSLRVNDNFCCLGVLCDIFLKEKNKQWKLKNKRYTCGVEEKVIPHSVKRWAGLEAQSPKVNNGVYITTLASLNDSGRTFKDIAKLIEISL